MTFVPGVVSMDHKVYLGDAFEAIPGSEGDASAESWMLKVWMRENMPAQKQAAPTKPSTCMHYGFVAASPSRALRDGEGTLHLRLNR